MKDGKFEKKDKDGKDVPLKTSIEAALTYEKNIAAGFVVDIDDSDFKKAVAETTVTHSDANNKQWIGYNFGALGQVKLGCKTQNVERNFTHVYEARYNTAKD